MPDRNAIAYSILAGAVLGGIAGFLFLTDRGRRVRRDLQPHLDEVVRELRNVQDLAGRVRETAQQGWQQVESIVGDLGRGRESEVRRH